MHEKSTTIGCNITTSNKHPHNLPRTSKVQCKHGQLVLPDVARAVDQLKSQEPRSCASRLVRGT